MKRRSSFLRCAAAVALGFAASASADAALVLQGVQLNGPLLQGVQLQGFKFNGPLLQGLQLNGPLIQGFRFNGPLLQGLRMNGPQLQGVSLQGALPLTAAFDAGGSTRAMYGIGEGVYRPLATATDAIAGHSPLSGLDARHVRVRTIAD